MLRHSENYYSSLTSMAEHYLLGLGKFPLCALDIIFMDALGTWIFHDVEHQMYLKLHFDFTLNYVVATAAGRQIYLAISSD